MSAENPVTDYDTAMWANRDQYARFHRHMLAEGIYLAPSQFEALFLSAAHTDDDVDRMIAAAAGAFQALARGA